MIHLLRTQATPEQLAEMLQIRPRQNNHSMLITDPVIRDRVVEIVRRLLEGT
jgi:hypothetical protein